jgi:hypothetical protein
MKERRVKTQFHLATASSRLGQCTTGSAAVQLPAAPNPPTPLRRPKVVKNTQQTGRTGKLAGKLAG